MKSSLRQTLRKRPPCCCCSQSPFPLLLLYRIHRCLRQENTQHTENNSAAMELINSITGSDEEGRSRQRILTFAAKRLNVIVSLVVLSWPWVKTSLAPGYKILAPETCFLLVIMAIVL
ncbi:hypothetical protein L1987_57566 [Smallanthus sonchifolius]|uniref:Uncharacterized protein n=1 Tax=Smallanthus sonchifolius TaxID=185202 RepID=A0ACB9DCY5_9ASTR|nr:hypothetical protein L1987_57566 [Smallanthus sonchifolius]